MLTTLNNYNCNYYLIMNLGDVKKSLVGRTHNTGFSKTEKTKITNTYLRFTKTKYEIKLKSHYFLRGFTEILKYRYIIIIFYI